MNYNNTQTPLSAMTQPIRDPQIILTIVFGVAGSVLALIAMIIAYLQLQKHKHTMNSVDAERNNMSLETIQYVILVDNLDQARSVNIDPSHSTQPQEATSTDQEQRESINTHVP